MVAERERTRALDQVTPSDRALLTHEVLERWSSYLAPSDLTPEVLADIARRERLRRQHLETLKEGLELAPLEWRFVHYLQQFAGQIRTYLQIAQHLWGTSRHPITAADLRQNAMGYDSPYIRHIWVIAGNVRKALEIDPGRPQHLATRRGCGYSWHWDPPSMHDGVDYQRLLAEVERLRLQMRYDLGYEIADEDLGRVERRPLLGPEHATFDPAISGSVVEASSQRH